MSINNAMSETKWTPGPLHVTKDQRREQWGVFSAPTEDASDRLVAVCMREADAALFAAAPALYEALEAAGWIMRFQCDVMERGEPGAEAWKLVLNQTKAALAAARGEA